MACRTERLRRVASRAAIQGRAHARSIRASDGRVKQFAPARPGCNPTEKPVPPLACWWHLLRGLHRGMLMVIPGLYDVPRVVAESSLTEEDVLNLGLRSDGIVFMVVVPELGACRVPDVALSHFMAGADEYAADAMPEHWSKQPSGPWTIKRDRLRILADSWEKHSDFAHRLLDRIQAALEPAQDTEAEALRTPQSTREPGFYTLEEAARAIAVQEGLNQFHEKGLCDDMLESDRDGTLTVRDGGGYAKFAPIRPTIPRAYCELVTPDDVNEWATRRGFPWRWLLASKTAPTQDTATPATKALPDQTEAVVTGQTPERRLALLRSFGGSAKYGRGEWTFKGIGTLVKSEQSNGFKRCDTKTIRADLKEAAQAERDAKSAGFANGLGQR